jgi:AmmeMemoRadiSam system protein A
MNMRGADSGGIAILSADQRRMLLDIARRSVAHQVSRVPAVLDEAPERSDLLPRASGVFVTLRCEGELRGCLGTLACQLDLAAEVARCAADAASRDSRFPPVAHEELSLLSIEISVLGPLEAIDPADAEAIAIGLHGLVVEHGRRRGLLLPQVAVEWAWTREEFLRQTCLKAGLRADAWRSGAIVYRFGAEVFGD